MKITRRDMLRCFAAATVMSPGLAQRPMPRIDWPESFLWGIATAAHQTEGNNIGSDYWVLEHIAATNFAEPSGDACDSLNRWQEDIALVQKLGLSAYRFSIEWARIEPEEGKFSLASLEYYRRICASCREVGIVPIVTYHHFTSPRWLAAKGGWENPLAAARFARYCERATRAIGDLIGAACTINEPNAQVTSYVMRGNRPYPADAEMTAQAARAVGSNRFGAFFMGDSFRVRDVCLSAHASAVQAIKGVVPSLKVGMTLALQDLVAGSQGEALYWKIFNNARLPFYQAAVKDDFLGVQPYMRFRTGLDAYLPAPTGVMTNRHGADASPDVLPAVIREAHKYCGAPILVSENGIDTDDDTLRCRHMAATIDELRKSLTDGIPILGYIHWTLLDNFEWRTGYAAKFGLYAVDRITFRRTPKPSAHVYRGIVAQARSQAAARTSAS